MTLKWGGRQFKSMVNPYEPARDPTEFEQAPTENVPADRGQSVDGVDTGGKDRWPAAESRSVLTAPLSPVMKTLLVYAGILVPVGSLLLASGGMPEGPEWQTGFLGDKLSFVLSGHGGFVLYPLAIIAIGCLGTYLFHDKNRRAGLGVQWILLGAVLLSLFYTVILWLVLCRTAETWLVLSVCQIGLPTLVLSLPWMARRLPVRWSATVKLGLVGILFLGFAVALLTEPRTTLTAMFGISIGFPVVASLLCGPVWALLAYGFVSLRIAYDRRPAPSLRDIDRLAGPAYWVTMLGAFALSIRLSFVHYSRLPTSPPPGTCYVVTAAAQGHPRFVGSWTQTVQGEPIVVNEQLRRLRTLEASMVTNWPRTHQIIRRVYNQVGPKMARLIGNAWLADLAYISLKPIEWCAVFLVGKDEN